ncbi:MAG: aminotransferase class I/II-fold pyridoxal phosphate-dependent enzyme, partial [Candidatus Omnitrophica bacterium]|nr:aminotransferase class I/II-fold pyridoxal phosphate-dependent enzyme [Candidatus Omnitrophota bacterium]
MHKFPKRNIIIPKKEFRSILKILFEPSIKKYQHVKAFELKFKEYVKSNDAIAVSSGRAALNLILHGCGTSKGSEILLCAYNFIGVPESLIQDGYVPVFVEADKNTYQIDINAIEKKITEKTKAIIVTHLFGQLSDIETIKCIAQKHNILIIEDAAQALGSYYKNRFAGTIADVGFFSFTGSKPLNTSYGGMIVTNSTALSESIRQNLSKNSSVKTSIAFFSRLKTYAYALSINRVFYSFIIYPLNILFNKLNIDMFEFYKKIDKSFSEYSVNQLNYIQGFVGSNQIDIISKLIAIRGTFGQKLISKLDHSIATQLILDNSKPCYFMIPLKAKDKHIAYKKLLNRGIDTNFVYAQDCSYLTKSN